MKVQVNEATPTQLNWLVAKCEGYTGVALQARTNSEWYAPTTDWAQGGPIIEREKIGVWWATHTVDAEGTEYGNHWYAEPGMTDENADKSYTCMTGPTPLIAAMRCFVASKLGEECDIPDELITGE